MSDEKTMSGNNEGKSKPKHESIESRLRDFAKKILSDRESGSDPLETAKDALFTIFATGEKARSELLRLIAREVRMYLNELGIRELFTNYSLEVTASLRLKPLKKENKKK